MHFKSMNGAGRALNSSSYGPISHLCCAPAVGHRTWGSLHSWGFTCSPPGSHENQIRGCMRSLYLAPLNVTSLPYWHLLGESLMCPTLQVREILDATSPSPTRHNAISFQLAMNAFHDYRTSSNSVPVMSECPISMHLSSGVNISKAAAWNGSLMAS